MPHGNGQPLGRPARLLDLYRRRARPLLIQPESYWYSTRSPIDQAQRIAEFAAAQHAPVAVSAALTPDLLVPWHHPTLSVVYATEAIALDDAGSCRPKAEPTQPSSCAGRATRRS